MKINRKNYEAYFVDAIEKNLSLEQERELAKFLDENIDLRTEFFQYSQCVLKNEKQEEFPEKDFLKKSILIESEKINESNYEEYFIAYKEGFLDESEKKNVESFITKNPSVKNDFSQYDNVFLQNEKIEFSDKNTLKRHGIQRFQWHAYSAVASVALLIVMFFTINNNIDLSKNEVLAYKQTQFSSSLQSKNISQLNQSNLEENEFENKNSTTAIISNNNDNREENITKMNDIEVSELPMAEMLVEYPQPILEHKYTDLYNNILIRQARRMQNQKNQSEIRFASNEEAETLSKNKDPISLLDLIMPKKIFGISIESIEMATNAD